MNHSNHILSLKSSPHYPNIIILSYRTYYLILQDDLDEQVSLLIVYAVID